MLCCWFIHPVSTFQLAHLQAMLVDENPKSDVCEIAPPACFSSNRLVCLISRHFNPLFPKNFSKLQKVAFTTFSCLKPLSFCFMVGWSVLIYISLQMSIFPNNVATEHILLVDSCESFS